MNRRYKPSAMALSMLRSIANGQSAMANVHGRANNGGAQWALVALRKHGYLDGASLTDKGRAAIEPNTTPAEDGDGRD